ncbi:MAG TPA: hypothetical protein DEF79_01255 [Gammaproteobacteria bacterium]|nr:hypothetical protein [Gammaproteobacteria bacterium]|tara:strand:+ start:1530 stop:1958 length:429 start_codon:yes stop_codon:yes gene_type:complete
MLKVILLLTLVVSATAWSGELTIKVANIKHEGVLYAAVYDDKEVFESDKGDNSQQRPGIVGGLVKKVTVGEAEGTIELEAGTYSIGFFIDKNDNEKLDTNFLGVPKEQFGFSNDAMGRFGPPSFEAASFTLDEETILIMRAR